LICEIITLCIATPIALAFGIGALRTAARKKKELQDWFDALDEDSKTRRAIMMNVKKGTK
jgi:hypothetical protein